MDFRKTGDPPFLPNFSSPPFPCRSLRFHFLPSLLNFGTVLVRHDCVRKISVSVFVLSGCYYIASVCWMHSSNTIHVTDLVRWCIQNFTMGRICLGVPEIFWIFAWIRCFGAFWIWSAHLVAHQCPQHSIVVRPTAVRAFRRTSFARRSFSTAAPLTWNSLPPAVLNCDSLSTFKSRLTTHLFSTAFC